MIFYFKLNNIKLLIANLPIIDTKHKSTKVLKPQSTSLFLIQFAIDSLTSIL